MRSPKKRKYDSVSSFRGLLNVADRDSDSSMMHLVNDNGYGSDGAQMSMSTQAGLPGMLNLSQASARGGDSSMMTVKRMP